MKNLRFYNSIFNNCTTNIASHVNEVYPGRVPRAIGVILPGLSPRLLSRNNLVKIRGENIEKEEMKTNQIEEKLGLGMGKVILERLSICGFMTKVFNNYPTIEECGTYSTRCSNRVLEYRLPPSKSHGTLEN